MGVSGDRDVQKDSAATGDSRRNCGNGDQPDILRRPMDGQERQRCDGHSSQRAKDQWWEEGKGNPWHVYWVPRAKPRIGTHTADTAAAIIEAGG